MKSRRSGKGAKPLVEPTKRPDGSSDESGSKKPANKKNKAEKARKKKSRANKSKARGKNKASK